MAGSVESATILITGATSGIGRATTLALAARGVRLVLLVRDHARGEEVAALALEAGAASAEVLDCDLSLLSSVRDAAAPLRAATTGSTCSSTMPPSSSPTGASPRKGMRSCSRRTIWDRSC